MLRTDFPLPSRGPIRPREAAITDDGIVTLGEAAIWMAREPAQEYPIVGECNGVRCRFTHARCTDDAGRPAFVAVVRYLEWTWCIDAGASVTFDTSDCKPARSHKRKPFRRGAFSPDLRGARAG